MVGMVDCRGVRGWAETTGAPLIGKSEWKDINVLNKYIWEMGLSSCKNNIIMRPWSGNSGLTVVLT